VQAYSAAATCSVSAHTNKNHFTLAANQPTRDPAITTLFQLLYVATPPAAAARAEWPACQPALIPLQALQCLAALLASQLHSRLQRVIATIAAIAGRAAAGFVAPSAAYCCHHHHQYHQQSLIRRFSNCQAAQQAAPPPAAAVAAAGNSEPLPLHLPQTTKPSSCHLLPLPLIIMSTHHDADKRELCWCCSCCCC